MAKWFDVSRDELKSLMGLDQKSRLRDYWSKNVCCKIEISSFSISRNRFDAQMHFLQFANNKVIPENDKLYKIRPIINIFNKKFQRF